MDLSDTLPSSPCQVKFGSGEKDGIEGCLIVLRIQGEHSSLYVQLVFLLYKAKIVGVHGMLEQVPGIVLCSHGVEPRPSGPRVESHNLSRCQVHPSYRQCHVCALYYVYRACHSSAKFGVTAKGC